MSNANKKNPDFLMKDGEVLYEDFPSYDFEVYRRSLVGQALLESLAEMDDFIERKQAYDIVRQFDYSILKVIRGTKEPTTVLEGSVQHYRAPGEGLMAIMLRNVDVYRLFPNTKIAAVFDRSTKKSPAKKRRKRRGGGKQEATSSIQSKDTLPIRIERRVDRVLLLATSALELNFPAKRVIRNQEIFVPVLLDDIVTHRCIVSYERVRKIMTSEDRTLSTSKASTKATPSMSTPLKASRSKASASKATPAKSSSSSSSSSKASASKATPPKSSASKVTSSKRPSLSTISKRLFGSDDSSSD